MAVFHAVERSVWKRALLLLSLLVLAGLFYLVTDPPQALRRIAAPRGVGEADAGAPAATPDDVAVSAPLSVTVEPVWGNFFDEYRLERERSRSMQMEQLRQLIESGHTDFGEREAVAELIALLERTDQELQAESLLRARGLTEALVVLGDHGVIVVVNEAISQTEAHTIGSIVAQVTGRPLDRITINDGVRLP